MDTMTVVHVAKAVLVGALVLMTGIAWWERKPHATTGLAGITIFAVVVACVL
jgi:hypothetical protein